MTAATGTPSLLRVHGLEPAALAVVWLLMATSGLVMQEPAPFDALMLIVIATGLVLGLKVNAAAGTLASLMALQFAGEVIGSSRADDIDLAFRFTLITFYLSMSAVFFACLVAWDPRRIVPVMMAGLVVGALIAAIAAIAGYFDLFSGAYDAFTKFGRAKGTFKDPNVFAPYLILPILYAISRILVDERRIPILWSVLLLPLLLALLLSFSRGAWGHFVVSSLILLVLFGFTVPSARVRQRVVLIIFAGGAAMALGIAWMLGLESVGDLFLERASLDQSYDQGPQGRFAGQMKAVGVIVSEPLGIGTFTFERFHHEQPHNVYLNVFLNSGWLGGFSFLVMMMLTAWRGLTTAARSGPFQTLAIPVTATFIGLMLEGLIIDIDHWRHLFVLIGLIWGLSAADARIRHRSG